MSIHLKLAYCILTTTIQIDHFVLSMIRVSADNIFKRISKKSEFPNRNFSKIQKVSNMYLFCSPSFYFGFFFFFFDRFLILLTFHLFCSSSSRHRLLVALNYLSIKLDYPYMRFYITMMFTVVNSWTFMSHESWTIWWRSKLSVSDNRILNRKEGIHSPKTPNQRISIQTRL